MGRIYTVTFSGLAVTTAIDFFEIIGASNKIVKIKRIKVAQSTEAGDAQSEQLRGCVKRMTGAYTSGSGGSAATPRPLDPGDAAATFTAETGNTSRATGGTSVVLFEDSFNVLGPGFEFVATPEEEIVLAASSAIVIGLETAPADSVTFNGTVVVEEIG